MRNISLILIILVVFSLILAPLTLAASSGGGGGEEEEPTYCIAHPSVSTNVVCFLVFTVPAPTDRIRYCYPVNVPSTYRH